MNTVVLIKKNKKKQKNKHVLNYHQNFIKFLCFQSDVNQTGDRRLRGPSTATFFCGDWSWDSCMVIIFPPLIQEGRCQFLVKNMHKYWLTAERTKLAQEKYGYVNWLAWHDLNSVDWAVKLQPNLCFHFVFVCFSTMIYSNRMSATVLNRKFVLTTWSHNTQRTNSSKLLW